MDSLDQLVCHSEQGMHSEKKQIIVKCNNTGVKELLTGKITPKMLSVRIELKGGNVKEE